jgi:hypothetical protein
MRPDLSVEGVVTMEEHAASMTSTVAMGTGGEQRRVDERPPFRANAFFSASDEAVDVTMHYDSEDPKVRAHCRP